MKGITLSLAALLLLSSANLFASAQQNIVFYGESGCQGPTQGSCAFDDDGQCCMWNTYVGSIAYSGNDDTFYIGFWYGSSECEAGYPQGTWEGSPSSSGSGCWDVGKSAGQAVLGCDGYVILDCTGADCV